MSNLTISLVDALRTVVEPGSKVRWDRQHGERHRCIVCGRDCMRTAVTAVCYTFEICTCGDPSYEHLVEQLWHRRCFKMDVREDVEVAS